MKIRSNGRAREQQSPSLRPGHAKEIYGILFLVAAVFLILCLLSYDALDPSFFTLAVGKKVQNLGGVVGAYLADLILNLFGYGGYLLPFAFLTISFTHFAQRNINIKFGWHRIIAYIALIQFASILSHLQFARANLGGRMSDAGGLIGWWMGGQLVRLFGMTGAYLITLCGLLLCLLLITQISLVQAGQKLQSLALFFFQKLSVWLTTFSTIAWARTKKSAAKLMKSFQEWRKKEEPKIARVEPRIRPQRPETPMAQSLPFTSPSVPEREKEKKIEINVTRDVDAAETTEPKILPRVDLKENKKKEQMELLTPIIADYHLPQLSFLDSESQEIVKIDEENLKLNSKLLEKKLLDYGVEGRITEIHPGPIITMYEFEPAAGVKVNKIVNLEDDLSLTMGGKSVRIIAPLPGKAAVGIEIPNSVRETVWLKEVIGHSKFQKADSPLTLALGKNTEGIPFIADLAKMPHLLVAGATGSGKSVSVNGMILSLLYKATPEQVRVIFIDPKMLELSIYEGIPHLLLPVVTNPKKASRALRWAVTEMERRYELLSKKGSRNIAGYNKSVSKGERLPFIMIVIDELADLMMTAAKDFETYITRLAQMARAAGIHMIVATQRPSVDVLTGTIKANFPARISFKVSSKHDSRTILDTVGSEHLLGMGDMLFMSGGTSTLLRIHAPFVSETEILRVVEHWKNQGTPSYLDESVLAPSQDEEENSGDKKVEEDFSDELYDQAITIVTETRQASISMIQRRLRIGYNRAARMIERMEREGVVGPADGARPREVFASNLNDQ